MLAHQSVDDPDPETQNLLVSDLGEEALADDALDKAGPALRRIGPGLVVRRVITPARALVEPAPLLLPTASPGCPVSR